MAFTGSLRRLVRFVPAIGFHHVLMLLVAAAVTLLSLVLAGCSSNSPKLPGIYVISMSYRKTSPSAGMHNSEVNRNLSASIASLIDAAQATLQVRVGYFGICVVQNEPMRCSTDIGSLAARLSESQDPLNLIWEAHRFKDDVLFPYLLVIAAAVLFLVVCLLSTFPGWHEETGSDTDSIRAVRPFPSRPVSQVALALGFFASVLTLVSVVWQHSAAVAFSIAVEGFGDGSTKSTVGTLSTALAWAAFSLVTLAILGLLVMILSIALLDSLADEVDDDTPQPARDGDE